MKSLFFLNVFLSAQMNYAQPTLPDAKTRAEIVRTLASEMQRLDGEALNVRKNRSTSWTQLSDLLSLEAEQAKSTSEFIRVLSRLDQSYPNLHATLQIGKDLSDSLPERIELKIYFMAEVFSPVKTRYVISYIHSEATYSKDEQPELGDELIAINNRPMLDWQKENLDFCKFPLQHQCDNLLSVHFEKEFLSWQRSQPLIFTLKRGSKIWDIAVESRPLTAGLRKQADCKNENSRYQNFQRVYEGNRACVYQSLKDPKTAVLRITSFDYSGLNKGEPIRSIGVEVARLYPWWLNNAQWDHLVIDLIDNTGGNAPTEYLEVLLTEKFQQLYITYKKTKELEDSYLRANMFWETTEQEIWFQNLIQSSQWSNWSYGDYISPVPMFCAEPDRDCTEGVFEPRYHYFKGKISLLVNQWCISACDDFVYVLTEQLGPKVKLYGQHQAADTAYSRLGIRIDLDSTQPKKFAMKVVSAFDPTSSQAFFTQTVVMSQAQNGRGTILSGIPVVLTEFVPRTWKNKDQWPDIVLQKALSN